MSNQSQFIPQQIFPGMVPCEGPKTIPILIDFSLGTTFTCDLSVIESQNYITCIQTLFIDNSANTASLTVNASTNTNQKLVIPAGSQAYLPILQTNPAVLQFTSTNPIQVMVQLMNFYLPPFVWSTLAGATGFTFSAGNLLVSDVILESAVANGFFNTRTFPAEIALVDKSSTITLGGTVQSAIAANAIRNRFIVHNPSTATEILQIMFGASGAGRIDLLAGATWDESGSTCFTGGVFIVAATTAHAYTAYEG